MLTVRTRPPSSEKLIDRVTSEPSSARASTATAPARRASSRARARARNSARAAVVRPAAISPGGSARRRDAGTVATERT